jgi:hypothetical protein
MPASIATAHPIVTEQFRNCPTPFREINDQAFIIVTVFGYA